MVAPTSTSESTAEEGMKQEAEEGGKNDWGVGCSPHPLSLFYMGVCVNSTGVKKQITEWKEHRL